MQGAIVDDKYIPNWDNDVENEEWYSDNLHIYRCNEDHYHWEITGHSHIDGYIGIAATGHEDTFEQAEISCLAVLHERLKEKQPPEKIH